jgi:acetoin utilization deacetylase AcuC-like enzyme
MNAVDALLDGEIDNGYVLARPPGHHAERDSGRGYCIFGNTSLAALHARTKRGVARVAIVDIDVHHGNGTEDAFYGDPSVLTISLHQDGLYPPGRGLVGDTGEGDGAGANLNIPLPPGGGRAAYEHAFEQVVLPALDRFRPDLLLVASGLDASMYDPNARMNLSADCFGRLARMLIDAAERLCDGRVLFIHEGGYSSMYVPYCGLRIVEELSGERTGVPDALNDGDPTQHPLHDHERAAVAASAANLAGVPTP